MGEKNFQLFLNKTSSSKLSSSLENQCWKVNNFLLDDTKFKFLVHSEAGQTWLAGDEAEISQLVEDVTKAGGFYPTESFTVLTNISVQCQGNDKWNFSTTNGSERLASDCESSIILTVRIFQLQLIGCQGTSTQVSFIIF